MEIVIRLVDGRLLLNSNAPPGDKVALLGMLELAKAAVLQQSAALGVQVPGPQLARQLLATPANGHG